jgi:hypothetical protein
MASDSVHRPSLTQGEGRECNAVVEADVENFEAFVDRPCLAKQMSFGGDPAVEAFTLKSVDGDQLQ